MTSQTVNHLRSEHQKIERVLAAFQSYLDDNMEGASADHRELAQLIEFLTESLMLLHEEKEETVLLPELARQGLSWSDGTLAHVRQDHRHGRYLLRSLRHATKETDEWSLEERRRVASVGREWVEFNRKHMALEEAQLFPYLDSSLDAEKDKQLLAMFENIDAEFDAMPDSAELRQTCENFVNRFAQAS